MFAQGLVDISEREVIADYCTRTVDFIEAGEMTKAFAVWDEMLNGDVYPYPNYFHNVTGKRMTTTKSFRHVLFFHFSLIIDSQ